MSDLGEPFFVLRRRAVNAEKGRFNDVAAVVKDLTGTRKAIETQRWLAVDAKKVAFDFLAARVIEVCDFGDGFIAQRRLVVDAEALTLHRISARVIFDPNVSDALRIR